MAGPQEAAVSSPAGAASGDYFSAGTSSDSSKFKRFLRRFGRRTSDDGRIASGADKSNGNAGQQAAGHDGANSPGGTSRDSAVATPGRNDTGSGRKSGSTRNKRSGSKTGKRSDSLLSGRFFQSMSNAPPVPAKQGDGVKQPAKPTSPAAVDSPKGASGALPAFGKTEVGQLADSLVMPSGSPAPQIEGVPEHKPLAANDVVPAKPAEDQAPLAEAGQPINAASNRSDDAKAGSAVSDVPSASVPAAAAPGIIAAATGVTNVVQPANSDGQPSTQLSSSPQDGFMSQPKAHSQHLSSDNDSELRRDSVDNATVNTTKSRASTKPTTLMSLDTRENVHTSTYAPIAQVSGATEQEPNRRSSGVRNENGSGGVQFATGPALARSASGTIVALPGQSEPPNQQPYTNVPSNSRPHPSNNPVPSSVPADNASVLTLASSTAAASILGGASSRGHSHAAPSMGGARSIGGSYMGDRRNSSDTYASVKALPPLSRRGSDSSQRTGMSVAASATGQNSHQAMTHGMSAAGLSGPGAPHDRISIHRTPSQRTVATQLSIPLSSSNLALAAPTSSAAAIGEETQTASATASPRTGAYQSVGSDSMATPVAADDGSGSIASLHNVRPSSVVSKDSAPILSAA